MRIHLLSLRALRQTALVLLAVAALPAFAHTGADAGVHHGLAAGAALTSSFLAGFLHPLTGLDHLAAMLAVGLWSALVARSQRELLWAPLAFVAALLAGALMGLAGVRLPGVEPMIAASLLVLGLLVFTQCRLPAAAAAALVGAFAIFHGIAHGHELAGASGAAITLAGMVAATALLHGAGIGLGAVLRHAGRWVPRTAGAGVALLGLALLGRLA